MDTFFEKINVKISSDTHLNRGRGVEPEGGSWGGSLSEGLIAVPTALEQG